MMGWALNDPHGNGLGPPQLNNVERDNGPGPHGPTDNWKDPMAHTMTGRVTPQP